MQVATMQASMSCIYFAIYKNTSKKLYKTTAKKDFGKYMTLMKSSNKVLESVAPMLVPRVRNVLGLQRRLIPSFSTSGRKAFPVSFLGLSAAAVAFYHHSSRAHAFQDAAVGDHTECPAESPSEVLSDLQTFWELARKFQLPVVILLTVISGWMNPLYLLVDVVLLLLCTRPDPFSIYLFVEQLRRIMMRENPKLYYTKFLYAKNVEVDDYKLLCMARVDLVRTKLKMVGILGGWWIYSSSMPLPLSFYLPLVE